MPDHSWRRLTLSRRALLPAAVLTASAVCAAVPSIATAAPDAAFATDIGAGRNSGPAAISQYKFGAGGTLVANGSVTTDAADFAAITPNASFLYDDAFYSGAVDQFAISSAGTLSPLTPAQVAAGPSPDGIATSPDGSNVYVGNSGTLGQGSTTGSISIYRVGTGGTLTSIQTISSGVSSPSGIAVSPDGTSVYVADAGSGKILEYNRASDGTLTPKPTASISAPINGAFIGSLVMTPDGQNLYASSSGGSQNPIAEYSVGSGGQLSPKSTASVTLTGGAYTLTVSPNGHNLYAPSCGPSGGGTISQFTIGSAGELTALGTPAASGGACVYQVWMNAAGSSAYATAIGGLPKTGGPPPGYIAQYDVSSTGALTPKTPATVAAPGQPVGFVIPPDQGPVAAFSDTPGKAGHATKFDASASSDSDGTVARYDWNFGDGTTLTNGGATPSHTYAKAGTYQVTVTTTDDSGCSTALVFTGQTAYCNAAPGATVTHTVKIAAMKVTPKASKLTVRPGHAQAGKRTCFTFRFTSHSHGVRGAKIRFAGHTTHTTSSGRSRVCVALHRGRYTAHASKHGYRSAHATVRITAAPHPPTFTG